MDREGQRDESGVPAREHVGGVDAELVEHRTRVVDPLLERDRLGWLGAIRQPDASWIEADDPMVIGEARDPARQVRLLEERVDRDHPRVHQQHRSTVGAEGAVGDVRASRTRVADVVEAIRRRDRVGDRVRVERLVVVEDRGGQIRQPGSRCDTDLLGQDPGDFMDCTQRLGRTPAAVQREDAQLPEALVERLVRHQLPELDHRLLR